MIFRRSGGGGTSGKTSQGLITTSSPVSGSNEVQRIGLNGSAGAAAPSRRPVILAASAAVARYNIVSEDDLAAAAERTAAYVARRRDAAPRVVALASVRDERAQNAHSEAAGEATSDTGKAVTA